MGLISFEMDIGKTTDGSCQRILALWQYDGDAARSPSSTLIRVFLSGDKRVSMLHVLLLSIGLTAGALIRKLFTASVQGLELGCFHRPCLHLQNDAQSSQTLIVRHAIINFKVSIYDTLFSAVKLSS